MWGKFLTLTFIVSFLYSCSSSNILKNERRISSDDTQEGIFVSEKNSSYLIYTDYSGKKLSTEKFAIALSFSEGFSAVKNDEKWGFLRTDGSMLTKFEFDSAYTFKNGFARVEKNKKINFIKLDGSFLLQDFTLDDAQDFENGIAPVMRSDFKGNMTNDLWGFLDTTPKMIISFQFTSAKSFNDGFAPIQCKNRKWGFIDLKGKFLYPCELDYAYEFRNGFAEVYKYEISQKPLFLNAKGQFTQ